MIPRTSHVSSRTAGLSVLQKLYSRSAPSRRKRVKDEAHRVFLSLLFALMCQQGWPGPDVPIDRASWLESDTKLFDAAVYRIRIPVIFDQPLRLLEDFKVLWQESARAQRYQGAFIAAVMAPELEERLKREDLAAAPLLDVARQAENTLHLFRGLKDGLKLAQIVTSKQGFSLSEVPIHSALEDWRQLVVNQSLSDSLGYFATAFSTFALSQKIQADAMEDLLMHTINHARTVERLECIDAFMNDVQAQIDDPAMIIGWHTAQEQIHRYLTEEPAYVTSVFNSFADRGADYVVRAALLAPAYAKYLTPLGETLAPVFLRVGWPYEVLVTLSLEYSDEMTDAQTICAAATLHQLFFKWEADLSYGQRGDPGFGDRLRKKAAAKQILYSLGYFYYDELDKHLTPEFSWLGISKLLGWFGNKYLLHFDTTTYRSQVLVPRKDEMFQYFVETMPYLYYKLADQPTTPTSPGPKYMPPTARIENVTPASARPDQTITFFGSGEDQDDIGTWPAIRGYRWTSDLGTVDGFAQLYPPLTGGFGPDSLFRLLASQLKVGTHTIRFQVQDNDGEVSDFAPTTLVVNAPDSAPVMELSSGSVESPIYAGNSARFSVIYRHGESTPPDETWVVLNGERLGLSAGSGGLATGKNYFLDKLFTLVSASNRYHFEFRTGASTYRLPLIGELEGPVVLPSGDRLVEGKVEPGVGDPSTVFIYSVVYRSPDGIGPSGDIVALFVDDTGRGINMSRVNPNDQNWSSGVRFIATVPALPLGTHRFHFSCAVGGTDHNVRYPESGDVEGPLVRDASTLTITIVPKDQIYVVGSIPEFDVEIRDAGGALVDVNSVKFYKQDRLSSYWLWPEDENQFCQRTSAGHYYFQLPNVPIENPGFHTYVVHAVKAGYPEIIQTLDLTVGVLPEEPLRLRGLAASPATFKPGTGSVLVRYVVSKNAIVSLRVLDEQGRTARTVTRNAVRTAGSHIEEWDGRGDTGLVVPVGNYSLDLFARSDITGIEAEVLHDPVKLGPLGVGAGQVKNPADIKYDGRHDEVLIASYPLVEEFSKIARFSSSGAWTGDFPSCSGQHGFHGVEQDGTGFFYGLDMEGQIFKYDKETRSCLGVIGGVGGYYDPKSALASDKKDHLYAVNYRTGVLFRRDLATGEEISRPFPGSDLQSDGLAVDGDGQVWVVYRAAVAGSLRNLIYVYDPNLEHPVQVAEFHSSGTADLGVKNGFLLYLHEGASIRVLDVRNGVWLPQLMVQGSAIAAVDPVENGFTYALADFGDYQAVRYRDRLSADRGMIPARAATDLPVAEVTSPIAGSLLVAWTDPTIAVVGTAAASSDASFRDYHLDVGAGDDPLAWRSIADSTSPVVRGILGNWVLDGVETGQYTLRLRVSDSSGASNEVSLRVNVAARNTPPETLALGPDGEQISDDGTQVVIFGKDDTTPADKLEYSWNLNGSGWTPFVATSRIELTGIGRGTNTLSVRARDQDGAIDRSPAILTFVGTVDHLPETPWNLFPFGEQANVAVPVKLIGSEFADRDPASSFSKAQFQVVPGVGTFDVPLWDSGELVTLRPTVELPGGRLASNTKYRWRVRYQDDSGGWSAWSAESSFTTGGAGVIPRTLTVQSLNPDSGVPVFVQPADGGGLADGTTPFQRVYAEHTSVTLEAPEVVGSSVFGKWQLGGQDLSAQRRVSLTLDTDSIMTAVYVVQPPSPRIEGLLARSDDTFQFTIRNEVGVAYAVQASTDLVQWADLTNYVAREPASVYMDTAASKYAYRYYRVRNGGVAAPRITTQPQSQTVSRGGAVLFAVAVEGQQPLSYQWLFNGTAIQGATAGSLSLTDLTRGKAGTYQVRVTNPFGEATSSAAALIVVEPDIQVLGNGQNISNGDVQPESADNTDFGDVQLRQVLTRTFTIRNAGDDTLGLTPAPPVQLSGSAAFTITRQPDQRIVTNGVETRFDIEFSPVATGPSEATVTIGSNDPDENPFTFAIRGVGKNPPPKPDGLVSWWTGEGNAADAQGSNNGVIEGSVAFASGMVGQGFSFDGLQGYVRVPASDSLNVGVGTGFTIEAWINPADIADAHPLFEWATWPSDTGGVHLRLSVPPPAGTGSGCLYVNLIDTNGAEHKLASPAALVVAGAFQHVALTYDNAPGSATQGMVVLYLNGAAIASTNLGSFTPRTGFDLNLGYRWAAEYFPGQMDEVALYNRALSNSEVKAIHDSVGETGVPVGEVLGNGQTILKGDATPDTADHTDFGLGGVGEKLTRTFIIRNVGSGRLQLTGSPLVQLMGSPSFRITRQPDATVAPIGGQTSFDIEFAPSDTSPQEAVVTIASNNPDWTPFTFAIRGVGKNPPPPPPGLVSRWTGEGNAADVQGSNNGVIEGSVAFASGVVGQGFSFDGLQGYVRVPASDSLNVGVGAGFTIEAWINPADIADAHPLLEWATWPSDTGGVHLRLSVPPPAGTGSGCLYVNLIDTNGAEHKLASPAALVIADAFQHVALTYDNTPGSATQGMAALYLNGAAIASANLGSFTPRTRFDLNLGYRWAAEYFPGQMDEIALYNRALSGAEIKAIYDGLGEGGGPH